MKKKSEEEEYDITSGCVGSVMGRGEEERDNGKKKIKRKKNGNWKRK